MMPLVSELHQKLEVTLRVSQCISNVGLAEVHSRTRDLGLYRDYRIVYCVVLRMLAISP